MDNVQVFHVTPMQATDKKPARVMIRDEHFRTFVIIPRSDGRHYSSDAVNYLKSKGYTLIGLGDSKNCTYIISSTFKPIK